MPNVLKNKQYIDYTKLSRYNNFPVYYHSKDEKYIYSTDAYLADTTTYSLYAVQKNDTFDSISLKFYNNPTYYWVICSFNHRNPYDELNEGETLKIPSMSTLKFESD